MKKPVLVIMAAGMGSRYGGLKQIDPVDPEGHIIMDFSLYDAKKAGFEEVIFIIKKENEKDFKETIGNRISKIMKAYEGTNTRPRIETTKNTFKIILPNVNINSGSTITSIPAKEEAPVFILNDNPALSSQEKRILEYARNYNQITKNNAASLLEVSASTATRLINGLLKQNLLVRHGKARNTYYTAKQ